jgi:hypothetical protein
MEPPAVISAPAALLILDMPVAGPLGRRCCASCHTRIAGSALSQKHVCPGYGRRVSPRLRKSIGERDGWICQLCGETIDQRIPFPHPLSPTADHCLPRVAGGPGIADNLQIAHKLCNELRDQDPLETLDFVVLRQSFARAWARYLRRHPYGNPDQVIAQQANHRVKRRAYRARRTQRRAEARALAGQADLPL